MVCRIEFTAEVAKKSSNSLDQERLEHLPVVSRSYPTAIVPLSFPNFPCHPEPSIPIDGYYEGSLTENQAHHETGKESTKEGPCSYSTHIARYPVLTVDRRNVARVTIDMFPDVVLLEIFDFYVYKPFPSKWITLVHVCQKWRTVVLGSPRRLDLRLFCSPSTPVRVTLDVWPLLPICAHSFGVEKWGVDNIIAVLERADRICELALFDPSFSISQWEKVLAAMLLPFPALTSLKLELVPPVVETAAIFPASFLGGYAPRLQTLVLRGVPFPGLPKLLFSATHLVSLHLLGIPPSGYILPKEMVTSLSVLTMLETLNIGTMFPRSHHDRRRRRPPPLTRTLLPNLTKLQFQGVSEYLEDFVAEIDTPLLDKLNITFSHQLIYDTPQFTQFINRTPKFKAHDEVQITFSGLQVRVNILPRISDRTLILAISCRQSDWQLSSLAQVCSSSFPRAFIPAVEHLYIADEYPKLLWQEDMESNQFLELFHPFTGVKYLYLSQEFGPRIAPALQELVEEGVTEVLPALQTIFLQEPLPSGPVQEIIGQYVAARQLACHPVALSLWDTQHPIYPRNRSLQGLNNVIYPG